MNRFGFIIHPLFPKDLARHYPIVKYLPDYVIEQFLQRKSPKIVSNITGIRSATGVETEGWFVGLPLVPKQMIDGGLPIEFINRRISQCVELAALQGAQLIGLGAYSSVVGDAGLTISKTARIGVTTGNSYTVATAIEGTRQACRMVGVDTRNATLAVVGGTGSIGRTCAKILGPEFGHVLIVGRDRERTQAVADDIPGSKASVDVGDIKSADAVVTVSSAGKELIQPEHLRAGCVVCDVARPRDVSKRVAEERPDVLVIEGGVVAVPGDVKFGFEFGFPERTAYACMSETMILALEGDPSLYNFTLGRDVTVDQVNTISRLAAKHGFTIAELRSFEKALDQSAVDRARKARLVAV